MIEILEHSSSSYGPRTYTNARKGIVTMALAADSTTGGERCTHEAVRKAGNKLIMMDLSEEWIVNARKLYSTLTSKGHLGRMVVNVAGNGMATLHKHGYTQQYVNEYVHSLLGQVYEFFHIDMIVSGGQTGVDIAGGWAAVKLGIPCTLTLPKGFLQRHEDGKDVCHTQAEILAQITSQP